MHFINKELNRISENLAKNTNVNLVYFQKTTKFGQNKYNYDYNNENKLTITDVLAKKSDISQTWLKQKFNNCRYNAFITLFYFNFSSFIKDYEEQITTQLKELNNLVIKLSEDVNDKNYYDIVKYL